jgi:hypothetical protein
MTKKLEAEYIFFYITLCLVQNALKAALFFFDPGQKIIHRLLVFLNWYLFLLQANNGNALLPHCLMKIMLWRQSQSNG